MAPMGRSSMGVKAPDVFEPYIPHSDDSGVDLKPSGVEYEHRDAHSGREGLFLRFNRQGNLLATAGGDSLVKLWDLGVGGSGDCVDTIRGFQKPVSTLAFSGSSDLMIACTVDRNIKLYNIKYRRIAHQMSAGHSETINASAFCSS